MGDRSGGAGRDGALARELARKRAERAAPFSWYGRFAGNFTEGRDSPSLISSALSYAPSKSLPTWPDAGAKGARNRQHNGQLLFCHAV